MVCEEPDEGQASTIQEKGGNNAIEEEVPPEELGGIEVLECAVKVEPQTLKVIGSIKNWNVTVMVDCGATHNFISPQVDCELHLPLSAIREYNIMIGNREIEKSA